eukprot:5975741-Pleurochrysis_carterae.AAC.1
MGNFGGGSKARINAPFYSGIAAGNQGGDKDMFKIMYTCGKGTLDMLFSRKRDISARGQVWVDNSSLEAEVF